MATEVCADLTAIQDEDVLRRMWADTEDFSRKKEIRARMYKLREQRLKDFYTSGDDAEINRKHQPTRHADTLQDQGFMTMKSKEIRDSESPTRDISIRKGNGYWDTRQETVYGRGKEDDKNVEIKYVDLEGRGVVKEEGIETKMAYATQTAQEKGWKEDENGSLKSEALTKVSQSASVSKGDNSEERSMSKKEEFSKRTEQKSSNSMSTSYSTSSSSSSRRVISSSYQTGDQDLSQNAIQYDVTSGNDFTTDNQNISKEDKTFSSQNEFKNSKEDKTFSTNEFKNSEKTVKNESKSVQEENAFSSQIESKREEKTITSQNSSNQLNTEEIKNLKNSEFIDSHRVDQVDRRDVKDDKVEDVQKFTQNTSEVTSKNEKVTEQKILNEIQKLDSYLSTHTPAPSTPISPQEPDGGWTLVSDKNDKNNEFLYQERTQPIKPQATSMDLPTSATDGQYTTTYGSSYNKISVDHSPSHDFFAKTLRSSPERSTPSPTKSVHSTSSRGSPERKKTSSKTSLERNSPVIKRTETKSPEKRRERIETKVETKSKRKFSTTKEKAANRNRVATPGASPTQSPVHKKLNKDSSDSDSDASQLTYNKHERKSQIKKEQSPGYSSEGSITKEIKKKESSPERSAFAPIKNFRTSPEKEKKELTIENVREHDDFIQNEINTEVTQSEVKTEMKDISQNEISKCYSTDTYVLEDRAKQTSKEVLNTRSPASSPERNSQRSESPTKKITSSTKVEIRSSSPTKKVTNIRQQDRSPSPTKKTTEIRRNSTEKTTKRSASPTKKVTDVRSTEYKRKIEPRSERPNDRSASPTKKRTETLNRSFSERRTTKTTETVQRRGSADKTTKISAQKISELSKPKQIPTRETLRTPVKTVQKTVKTEYKSPVRVAPKKTPEPKKPELRKAPETKKTPEPKKTPVSTRTVQKVVQKTVQTKVVKEAPKVRSTTVTRVVKEPVKKPETRRPSEEKKPPSRNNSQKSITKSVPKSKVEKITVTSAQETKRRETQNFLKKETQGVSDLEDETPPDEFFADYDDEDTVDYVTKQKSDKQTKYKRETDQDYLNVIVQLPKSSRESSPGYPENFIATTSEEGESNPRYADFVSEPEDVEVFAPLSGPSGPIESTEEIPKSVAEKVSVFLNEAKKSLETKTTTNQVVIEKSVSEAKTLFENASKNDVPVKQPEIEEFNQVINKVSKEVPKIPRKDTPVPKPPGKTFVKEEDKPSNLDVNSKKSFFEKKAQETYMKSTVASDVRVRTPEKPKETERKPSKTDTIDGSYMRSTVASDVRRSPEKSEIERKPSKTEDGSYMRSTVSSDVRSRSPDKLKESERKPSKPDITDERRQSTDITETYMKSTIASNVRSHSPEQRKSSLVKEQDSPTFKTTKVETSEKSYTRRSSKTDEKRSPSPKKQRSPSPSKKERSPSPKKRSPSPEKSSLTKPVRINEKTKTEEKFGVQLRKTPSATKFELSQPRKSLTGELPEIESIFDLEILEQLLIKAEGYEERRRIRAQIRLVKKELEEKHNNAIRTPAKNSHYFVSRNVQEQTTKTSNAKTFEPKKPITKTYEEKATRKSSSPERKGYDSVLKTTTVTTQSTYKRSSPERQVRSSPQKEKPFTKQSSTDKVDSYLTRKSSKDTTEIKETLSSRKSSDKFDTSFLNRKSSSDKFDSSVLNRKSSSDKFDSSVLNRKSSQDSTDKTYSSRRSSDKLEFTRKPAETELSSTRSTKTSSNDYTRKSSTESSSFLSTRRSSTEGVKDAKIKPIESPFFAKDAALAEKSGVQKRTFERKVTTTTTTTQKKSVSETDSITSSYGVGPTDENGRPLFGLRALRKSNNTEQTPTNETVCTKQTTYTTQTYTTETNSPVSLASLKISDSGRRYSGPEIVEVTDEYSKKRTSKDYTVEEASDLNQENVAAFTSHMRDYQKAEDKKPFVRGDSVKALQHKFQQATEAANQPSGGSSYPKAGLILRSNSLLQYDDPNQMSSSMKRTKVERVEKRTVHDSYDGVGEKQVVVKAQMSEKIEDSNGLKSARDLRGVQAVQTTLTRDGPVEKSATAMRMTTTSGGTTSTTSFLDNNSKVTGVQDILTRMRNADLVTETGDTAEDAQARALLNKFLGASVILQGMEQGMKHETGQQRSATLVGQADKQLVKATNRIREENIDEIYDESQLKNLLDSSTDLEDRRKLRARLREMAEEKEYTASLGATEEEFAPAKVHTRVTSSTAKLTKANSVQSPFAKFKQLERQNSAPSCGRTLKVSETRFPTSASSIKERLLGWVQAQTREYKNVQVENFSTSWSDGLAFCALIHHFCPDAFDFSTLTPNRRRYNFELAFKVAEEKADIYPLLDAEDMVTMSKPDWKCVFTYVQSIYQKFHDSPLSVPTNPYL